jgi:TIR domain
MRVFISHAAADGKLAKALAKSLKQEKIEAWLDDTELMPGDDWRAASATAMEESDAVVVLMSKHSDKSPNVTRDIQYVLCSPKMEGRVIPVLVGKPTGSWALRKLASIRVGDKATIASAGKKIAQHIANHR